jgi:hypothetical protein
MASYSSADLRRGFAWLGHAGLYTELVALHPECRRDDPSWNREHQSWPEVFYITQAAELEYTVRRYAGKRLLCYGINPRPRVLTKPNGNPRSATEDDVTMSLSTLLDIDAHDDITPARLTELRVFLDRADAYWRDLGVARPVRAATGRGSHLLFAYPKILVGEHPDIRDRLVAFRESFVRAHKEQLDRLEVRVDSVQDLRRMVRVYGTCRPDVGIVSRFYGNRRREDAAFREYLLGLDVRAAVSSRPTAIAVGEQYPDWFTTLLGADAILRGLWEGTGKNLGDQTESGYDFSIIARLARLGYRDASELATILALRPSGRERRLQKGPSYLTHTVSNALARVSS